MVLDIKDCFFSIPLHEQDRERFAFTLPSINHEEPDKRFQWKVLPQGMANSPTMCQIFMDGALEVIRGTFPQIRILHYMDDILLAHSSIDLLQKAFSMTIKALGTKGLVVAPDKMQTGDLIKFLGSKVQRFHVSPQKIQISMQNLRTLNDYQRLLGDINWLRGFLRLPRSELVPLFKVLEGNPDINSPRQLTQAAKESIIKV